MAVKNPFQSSKLRILTGCIIGLSSLFCIIRGGITLLILVAVFTGIGSRELVRIFQQKGFYPSLNVILAVNYTILLLVSFKRMDLLPMIVSFGVIASFLAVLFKGRQPYIANVATTVLAFLFASLPAHLILIRQLSYEGIGFFQFPLNEGLGFILLIFFVILMTDIGAYYFGSKYGKTPLCPVISPKKTVEGAIGGAIIAVITSLAIGAVIHLEWYHSLIVGILITIFAQLGDLSESLIKRDAGVKDSGNSIPGHGGFLDRADSYILSAPIAYYYFYYFVVEPNFLIECQSLLGRLSHVLGY